MVLTRFFKQTLFLLFFLLQGTLGYSTSEDSLQISIDSLLLETYVKKIDHFLEAGLLDSAKLNLDLHAQFVPKNRKTEYYQLDRLCKYFESKGQVDSAEYYCKKAIVVAEEEFNLKLISNGNTNLATVYAVQGKTTTALQLLKVAYEIDKERGDNIDLAITINNIGYIYMQHKEYLQAFEKFEEILSLKFDKDNIESTTIHSTALLNLAEIHFILKEYDETTKILRKLTENNTITKESSFENYVYLSLLKGKLAMAQGSYSLARKIFLVTVKEANNNELPLPKLNAYLAIGDYYLQREQFVKAYEVFERAYKITKSNKLLDFEYEVSLKLAEVLKSINKDQSIYFYEKSIILSDSLYDIQKSKAIADMRAFHEVENQKEENDVLREIELNSNLKIQTQEKFILFIVIIVMFLLVFLYYINLSKKKEKKLNFRLSTALDKIEMANMEIENVNEELIKKNNILKETLEHSEAQGKQLNYQNRKISSSIRSASLIQSSILPEKENIDVGFPDNFIFNQPKDIVSGDFYWYTAIDGWKIYACIDCTGHGVPGALMSMMGSSSLYEIVRGKKIFSPAKILEELNNIVVRNLQQEKTLNNDGMDMSIIAVKDDKVYCAGAKNPIYIVRNKKLHKINATRKSIGGALGLKYEEEVWDVQKGDCLYMASDGYQDQFGGINAKKFMVKKFRELLTSISDQEVPEQKQILDSTINDWMKDGDWEQVDDMLVVGIKF